MKGWVGVVWGSISAIVALLLLLPGSSTRPSDENASGRAVLRLACAAGIRAPIEAIVQQYEAEYGVITVPDFGGSGTLLATLQVRNEGDLFLAADETYIQAAIVKGFVSETIPLARQRPVIAVARGNPKRITGLSDLLRSDVRVSAANPDQASIGRALRALLEPTQEWTPLKERITVFKTTVNEVANDVKIGAVDAGIVWDATARQYPDLEIVSLPRFEAAAETVTLGVLSRSRQHVQAMKLARYIAARDRGLAQFRRFHYEPVRGDFWAAQPEITLFCEEELRSALEPTLEEFSKHEGCRIIRIYKGSEYVISEIRSGQIPDAYLTRHEASVNSLADLFLLPEDLTQDELTIVVPKGNPKGVGSVDDLMRPGLRLGFPSRRQSAAGMTVSRALAEAGISDYLEKKSGSEAWTPDFLFDRIRAGALDAVLVSRSDWTPVKESFEGIPTGMPSTCRSHKYAISRTTRYPQLMRRLGDALAATKSRDRLVAVDSPHSKIILPKP